MVWKSSCLSNCWCLCQFVFSLPCLQRDLQKKPGWISLRSHSPECWFFVWYASDKTNNTKKDFISLHVTRCSNVPSDLSETCDSYQHLWKSKGPIPHNAIFPKKQGFIKGSLNHHHTLTRPYWGLISLVVTWHWRVYTLSFPFKDWAFMPCIHPDLQLLSFFFRQRTFVISARIC